ncbi:ATP-binding cassette sub-family A member 6 isoform X3 [Octodon degus]|uniref:ATP-binding cassette sub-family A member 6 isoform X3 n=1 Tax=Octodon degus TaxID=10160 RepID=A0A6P6EBD9_OCTDE|nr:ATP-binding cassette sub-family A member 6 isoform X3 [Octodon degus]
MNKKQRSVCQQTLALLRKNFLKKWRMKRESSLKLGLPILLGLYTCLLSYFGESMQFPGMPPQDLGRVDKFNHSIKVLYMPISNTTQQIMNKTTFLPIMREENVIGVPNKTYMDKMLMQEMPYAVGVIFSDTFSYKLKFFQGYTVPPLKETDLSPHCWKGYDAFSCKLAMYWNRGFVTLQTVINAAIIEVTTNHSVMEELMSVTAINMKTLPFISRYHFQSEIFILFCLIYFSSCIYFVSLDITKERKMYKNLMKMMGLRDSAFWLSWGLIYAGFIFIISLLITIIITATQAIVMTGFMVIFTLFFLYGLSLVTLAFLMSVLLQKAVLANLIVFLLTLFWGCMGFTSFHRQLPSSLEWILSICSPFAFTSGMTQIIYEDYNMNGVTFPDSSGDSYTMLATFAMLALDGLIYLLLALYSDRILPYGYERRYSPLFCLNSSSCFQHRKTDNKVFEKEVEPERHFDDYFEAIAPEFQGKDAIRIRNVKKEYKGKSEKVEVLKGLYFDIYESQITAILGHSGAGKSSLLNIINGLSVPTEGSVTVCNKNISEIQDLEEIRKMIGFCPQHNVQFDILTVKENLSLFANIKGILPQEVDQKVQQILLELDMQNIQNNLATDLNEGQKRKLTFGIAVLGNPRVLLLDEPTAGLDPFSRHRVWSFLKECRANHLILLTTQSVDEADILADRTMILSNGRLKCAGSSAFLKRKWGLGYHLSFYKNEICDPEQVTAFINHHIPDAKLKTENKEKLVYALPSERTSEFPDLFRDLERCSGQGLMSYDISMPTLSEVFMNMEGTSTVDQDGEHNGMMGDSESLGEIEPAYSSRPEVQKPVGKAELWWMQACAMARLRFLKLIRGRKSLLVLLLIFGLASFPLIMEDIFYYMLAQNVDWEFKTELYFLSPGQLSQDPRTSLLIINHTESDIEDFIQSLKHQNILLEVDDFKNRNGTEALSYNGAIIVSGKRKDYRFSVVCNTKRIHCFPILMSIISNGLLWMFNQTQYIRTERSPFPQSYLPWMGMPDGVVVMFYAACSFSPYMAMSSIGDYKKKAKSQLWISGLFPSAYWIGQAVVDIGLFSLSLLLMYLIVCFTRMRDSVITSRIIFTLVVSSFGYAVSMIFFTYVIAFIFRKRTKNSGLWSFFFYIVMSIAIFLASKFLNLTMIVSIMVLVPVSTLGTLIMFVIERIYSQQREHEEGNFDLSGVDLLVCLIPYLQAFLFIFVLRCMELKFGKKVIQKDPLFRIAPPNPDTQPNPEEPGDEDEDVQAERMRTSIALTTSNLEEKPVIIASCLHKEYTGQKKNCFSKRKKKLATRNISFSIKKGEIFGLLGPNGAGKSSSIRMIAGITKPTAGKVELKGHHSVWDDQGADVVRFLGHCPQENVLWPRLTVKEHLEVYAVVKGLRKADAAIVISRLVNTFKLHEHLNVPVGQLAAGTTRKLCFVLSILGDSPVLLLDEPSTGVDPSGQHQIWQAVQMSVKNTDRAILLITHYLAEAEALCDRVAIMVSGRLRCIGSIQHLKSKFGKDYLLEMKVRILAQVQPLHEEILRLFPQAARQERFSSLMVYKLPMEDVQPLSQTFSKLETVKQNFDLEEYSLSQSTLEQVFLELSEEQERGDFDEDQDPSVRWTLLPPEEA